MVRLDGLGRLPRQRVEWHAQAHGRVAGEQEHVPAPETPTARSPPSGTLVTNRGFPVEPAIQIPPEAKEIQIAGDGTVAVITPGTTDPQIVGTLQLARFANPSGLVSMGENVYQESPASGAPTTGTAGLDGFGQLRQGFLERSNVSVVNELVSLIVAQRAYEINTRAIRVGDEMLGNLNELIR